MTDRKGDPSKQPPECHGDGVNVCPHLKEVGGGFDGERYRCDVCGESFFLDYDEMPANDDAFVRRATSIRFCDAERGRLASPRATFF